MKVMAFGTFDTLHPGHIFFLSEAKKFSGHFTVVIARDTTVAELKGHSPRHNEIQRAANVMSLGIANRVRLGNLDNKFKVIEEEKPDIIALGYDQTFFTEDLERQLGGGIKIIRLPSFKPEVYKSSKLHPHSD